MCISAQANVKRDWFGPLTPTYMRTYLGLLDIKKTSDSRNGLKLDESTAYGLALGKELNDFLATEVALRIANASFDNYKVGGAQTMKMYSLFFNGYLKKKVSKKIMPYLMGGVGGGYNSSNSINLASGRYSNNATNRNVLYDVGIGTFIKITDHILLDLNCKHIDLGKVEIENMNNYESRQKVSSREFMMNLVYEF